MHAGIYPEVPDDFGHWLAGFIDGEGSFSIIAINGGANFRCHFTLTVRDDDALILRDIHAVTGIGKLYRHPSRRAIEWHVSTKPSCAALVTLLDRFPLRAKKARDYATWREAVLLWLPKRASHKGHWGRTTYDWAGFAGLRARLMRDRAYDRAPVDEFTDSRQQARLWTD